MKDRNGKDMNVGDVVWVVYSGADFHDTVGKVAEEISDTTVAVSFGPHFHLGAVDFLFKPGELELLYTSDETV